MIPKKTYCYSRAIFANTTLENIGKVSMKSKKQSKDKWDTKKIDSWNYFVLIEKDRRKERNRKMKHKKDN